MNGYAAVSVAKRLGVKSIYEVRGLWEVTRLVVRSLGKVLSITNF